MVGKIAAIIFFLPYPIIRLFNMTLYCIRFFFLLMFKEGKGPITASYYSFSGFWSYYLHCVKEEYKHTEDYFNNPDYY